MDHWRTAGNDTATMSSLHSTSKLRSALPHNMDSTGIMIIPPIRSSSLPLLPDLHPRPHPTRSHADPSPSRPPQLPPLSIPPPLSSNVLDLLSRDEDCSFTFSSPPSSPSSPLLHTRFSVSKLSLATDSESLLSKCSSPADNIVSDDPTEPPLRSWFPRSLISRPSTESYTNDLDTPVPNEATLLTQQPPKLWLLSPTRSTLHTVNFPYSPSISPALGITPLPTSSQSAPILASNSVSASTFSAPTHISASLPLSFASTLPPSSLPSTPGTPAFSRSSTPPPLSLPVTPPSFSWRSSLVRAQSTPALAPSSNAFRLSRRRAFTTHSTSTPSTPSTPKRFVSAVRLVMQDIKGFATGRRVKSPERKEKNVRVGSLLDRSSSRSSLYRIDTAKLTRENVDRDWRWTFARGGVIGV